jgi:Leucine-rich repeat (LRR) protein
MAKPTPLKDALKALEAKEEMPKEEMENVKLYGFMPPIAKLDASLSTLKKCKKLSLSTNTIDKITSVSGMDRSVATPLSPARPLPAPARVLALFMGLRGRAGVGGGRGGTHKTFGM